MISKLKNGRGFCAIGEKYINNNVVKIVVAKMSESSMSKADLFYPEETIVAPTVKDELRYRKEDGYDITLISGINSVTVTVENNSRKKAKTIFEADDNYLYGKLMDILNENLRGDEL